MDEQRIWAPWRLGYVAGEATGEPASAGGKDQPCFLCRAAESDTHDARQQNLVVDIGEQTVTLLNRYPYANGHLLVAPRCHVGMLHELTDEQHLEAMQSLAAMTQTLGRLIKAEGFNVGLNLGNVAGAGVPGHLHWHLVPRWPGDNNFMPTVAGTRVIPQSLDALWEAIVEALAK